MEEHRDEQSTDSNSQNNTDVENGQETGKEQPGDAAPVSNNRLIAWLEKKVFPVLSRLNNMKFLEAIRESVFSALPLIGIGFILFLFKGDPAIDLKGRALEAFSASLGLLGIWVSFFIPFAYSKKDSTGFSIVSGILSLTAYLLLFPGMQPNLLAIIKFLGELSQGGVIFGFISGGLFVGSKELLKKRGVPFQYLAVAVTFGLLLGLSFWMKSAGVDIFSWIKQMIRPLLVGADTLPAAVMVVFLMSLFWLAGIHGTGVVGGIVLPFYLMLLNANVAAQGAGEPLPYIVTPPFFILCMVGGTGATLPLVVYMLFSKVERLRKLAKICILPSLVNVNEPLVFGVPLILNPIIAIPFVLTPVVLAVINYCAFLYHIVDRIFILPLFVIPMPMYAYLGTLDYRAAILSVIDIVIAFVIYYPFYLALEKAELEKAAQQNGEGAESEA